MAVAAALPLVLPVLDVWGLRDEAAAGAAVSKSDVRRVLANVCKALVPAPLRKRCSCAFDDNWHFDRFKQKLRGLSFRGFS